MGDFIGKLFDAHPTSFKVLALSMMFCAGWLESHVFAKRDLACFTWFWTLIGLVAMTSFSGDGDTNWIRLTSGVTMLLSGTIILVLYYKKIIFK